MPNPKPTFDKIADMLLTDAINETLKDLAYAKEEYGTAFGRGMLDNAIIELKRLKDAHVALTDKPSA